MAYTQQSDGLYHIPIVDLGNRLQDHFGLTIKEHSHFDEVDNVHAPNSYHYYDEAIDIQDWRDDDINGVGWKQRTANLRDVLKGSGVEIIGPGDMSGHDTHVHAAAKGGIFKFNQQQYDTLFGGGAGGKLATFGGFTPPEHSHAPANPQHTEAKTRAQDYSKMSKAQLDSAYDAMRSDPAKAREEGMKMHKAYFGKK